MIPVETLPQVLAELAIAFLLVLGGAFILIGSWALARFPSLMTRLHGPTKATTLGVGSCLIASMIYFPAFEGKFTVHELLITVFLFISAPVAANTIAKSHMHRQKKGLDPNVGDGIPDGLPKLTDDHGWATFRGGEEARDVSGQARRRRKKSQSRT